MIKNLRTLTTVALSISFSLCSPAVIACVNPPSATVTQAGPLSICQGSTVTLHTNNTPGLTYQWKKGGVNVPANGNDSTYVASVAGIYTVDVSSGIACSTTSASVVVTVNPLPPTAITITGNLNFCQGGGVQLCLPTYTGYTYQWKNATGNISGATGSCYYAVTGGSYKVISIDNATGCTDSSGSIVATPGFGPAAVISPSGQTSFCQGSSVILHTNNTPGYSYQWKLNGVNVTAGGNDSTYAATAVGNYTVDVAANGGGCISTANPVLVISHSMPVISITVTNVACYGECNGAMNFVPNVGGGLTYAVGTGPYSYTYSFTNLCAAIDTLHIKNYYGDCVKDTIIQIMQPAPLAAIATIITPLACNNLATVSVTGSGGTAPYKYKHGVSGTYDTASVFTGVYAFLNKFYVEDAKNCTSSDTVSLVNPFPPPNPDITYASGLLYTSAYTSYQWSRNGTVIPGATSQYCVPTQNGIYTVTVTDGNGCDGTSGTLSVESLSVESYPSSKGVTVYPNPANNIINIDAIAPVNATMRDIQGRIVLQQDNAKQMNISNLTSGIYILTITDNSGTLIRNVRITKSAD